MCVERVLISELGWPPQRYSFADGLFPLIGHYETQQRRRVLIVRGAGHYQEGRTHAVNERRGRGRDAPSGSRRTL